MERPCIKTPRVHIFVWTPFVILLLGCAGASGRGPGPGATGALEPMVGETAAPGDARVVTGAAGGLSE